MEQSEALPLHRWDAARVKAWVAAFSERAVGTTSGGGGAGGAGGGGGVPSSSDSEGRSAVDGGRRRADPVKPWKRRPRPQKPWQKVPTPAVVEEATEAAGAGAARTEGGPDTATAEASEQPPALALGEGGPLPPPPSFVPPPEAPSVPPVRAAIGPARLVLPGGTDGRALAKLSVAVLTRCCQGDRALAQVTVRYLAVKGPGDGRGGDPELCLVAGRLLAFL